MNLILRQNREGGGSRRLPPPAPLRMIIILENEYSIFWKSHYALTTHKAQGSTIDYVFLDLADMRGCSARAQLQYTALTRARTQVLIPQ